MGRGSKNYSAEKLLLLLGVLLIVASLAALFLSRESGETSVASTSEQSKQAVPPPILRTPPVVKGEMASEETDSAEITPSTDAAPSETERSFSTESPPERAIQDELIVSFETAELLELFLDQLDSENATVLHRIPEMNAVRVQVDSESSLESLQRAAQASAGTPSFNFSVSIPPIPREDLVTGSQGIGRNLFQFLGIPENNEKWGEGVTIAVLDSAVVKHESFPRQRVLVSSVFESLSQEPSFHGTAVTSSIVARSRVVRGVAPAARILAIEVLDSEGSGDAFTVASGIFEAVERGADIINLSLGTASNVPILKEAIDKAVEEDVVVVAAAGNEAQSSLPYPARYEGVLAVSSVDGAGRAARFVNTAQEIDIAAPGVGVFVAVEQDQFGSMNGTSISAPLVSGAIAALLSQKIVRNGERAVELLLENANDAGLPYRDNVFGEGILNVGRALFSRSRNRRDAAIADHILDRERMTDSEVPLLITVENRGTTSIKNLNVRYQLDGRTVNTVLPKQLKPGELSVIEVPLRVVDLESNGGVRVSSEVRLSDDIDPSNNRRQTRVQMRREN